MNKPQILFVEDDTAVGNLIATTLETQNYQFHRAKNGGQAVMDACDILLTTNEIYNTKARQLFIPMVPLTGTEGEIAELRAMYRLLCRYGKKGGVAYVTV